MFNDDLNVVSLRNPRAILLKDGTLVLKMGSADFLRCRPDDPALAVLQHQVNALCDLAQAHLERHESQAESFIARLLKNAPMPVDDPRAVAVECDSATATVALGFQYEKLSPWATRLPLSRAKEMAARINMACPHLTN